MYFAIHVGYFYLYFTHISYSYFTQDLRELTSVLAVLECVLLLFDVLTVSHCLLCERQRMGRA